VAEAEITKTKVGMAKPKADGPHVEKMDQLKRGEAAAARTLRVPVAHQLQKHRHIVDEELKLGPASAAAVTSSRGYFDVTQPPPGDDASDFEDELNNSAVFHRIHQFAPIADPLWAAMQAAKEFGFNFGVEIKSGSSQTGFNPPTAPSGPFFALGEMIDSVASRMLRDPDGVLNVHTWGGAVWKRIGEDLVQTHRALSASSPDKGEMAAVVTTVAIVRVLVEGVYVFELCNTPTYYEAYKAYYTSLGGAMYGPGWSSRGAAAASAAPKSAPKSVYPSPAISGGAIITKTTVATVRCFNCGLFGHIKRDCPKPAAGGGSSGRGRGRGGGGGGGARASAPFAPPQFPYPPPYGYPSFMPPPYASSYASSPYAPSQQQPSYAPPPYAPTPQQQQPRTAASRSPFIVAHGDMARPGDNSPSQDGSRPKFCMVHGPHFHSTGECNALDKNPQLLQALGKIPTVGQSWNQANPSGACSFS